MRRLNTGKISRFHTGCDSTYQTTDSIDITIVKDGRPNAEWYRIGTWVYREILVSTRIGYIPNRLGSLFFRS